MPASVRLPRFTASPVDRSERFEAENRHQLPQIVERRTSPTSLTTPDSILAVGEYPTMAKQKREELLAPFAEILGRRPQRTRIRSRSASYTASEPILPSTVRPPQQPRHADRIAPVRLDPLARTLGYQRGRNDIAAVAEIYDLAIKTVTSRAGFVAKMRAGTLFLQLAHEPLHRRFEGGAKRIWAM
ncbi:hypothetical protein NKH70_33120 [Mesorhizobium sp. M0991]|uniref:hypothetical protein n=1 Tax=Mesorhizobium sp. M0991 TaxID=2957043 RepID=UPI00333A4F61